MSKDLKYFRILTRLYLLRIKVFYRIHFVKRLTDLYLPIKLVTYLLKVQCPGRTSVITPTFLFTVHVVPSLLMHLFIVLIVDTHGSCLINLDFPSLYISSKSIGDSKVQRHEFLYRSLVMGCL